MILAFSSRSLRSHPNAALPTTSMVMWPNWRQMLSSRPSWAALVRMAARRSAPIFISLLEISREAELNTGSQLFLALLWKSLLQVGRHTLEHGGPQDEGSVHRMSP